MRTFISILTFCLLISCGNKEDLPTIYNADGVAIDGYDPVAYFTQSDAVKGNSEYKYEYQGVTYHFSSEEHKKLFVEASEKYAPAYGGWCAYAIAAKSKKMQPDPTSWKIQDGKLILFYDDFFTGLQGGLKKKWEETADQSKIKADNNWTEMSK